MESTLLSNSIFTHFIPAIFAALVSIIHVYIFALESLLWGKPKINRVFGVSKTEAEALRVFAFNQGFYNLFLAIAMLACVLLPHFGLETEARILGTYGACSVIGAGCVLYYSSPRLLRPALIQIIPATLYLLSRLFVP
jgi:putative membrane protein